MAKKYGAWEIESSLGEGGQGQTFRVVGSNGQRGVLKRLKNPKRGWRFEREINALRQLQSGKIPRLLDTGSNNQHVWVVIEDCGESLPSRMENDSPFDLRVKWFCDVVEAVCDAHELGIVHRDIKPNNIVVAQDLTSAYLIDFGICEITGSGPPWTTSEEAFGNAAFAAPECLLGRTEPPGPACDIYSLGKVLYWMLSGEKYILREQLNRIEREILHASKNVRARVVRLIKKAVVESPAARCSAQEMTTHSKTLLDYIKLLSAEAEQGIMRLIDNLGTDGNFNQSSSRHIASRELGEADIHPNIKMIGFPQPHCAQAERFENYYPYPIQLNSITLGLRCSSLQGEFEILLVGDQDKQPSTQIYGQSTTSVEPVGVKLQSIDIPCEIPPGPFWIVLKPSSLSGVYLDIHSASDEVSPQPSTFAESFDGGNTWQVRESPGGPGFAIRAVGRPVKG